MAWGGAKETMGLELVVKGQVGYRTLLVKVWQAVENVAAGHGAGSHDAFRTLKATLLKVSQSFFEFH